MRRTFLFGFSKDEAFGVVSILLVIFFATFINLQISLRRSRDSQRKSDIRDIYNALAKYQNDFGTFPLSKDGEIVACGGKTKDELGLPIFESCRWGWDSLVDTQDLNYPEYLTRIPADPYYLKGFNYYYISNGSKFQMYASLEGRDEAEFDSKIEKRNLSCGSKICNFGLASGKTPLNISIEEYENQIKK